MFARPLTFLIAFLVLFGTARAEDCQSGSPEVDTGPTPVGHWYVDNDECQPDCLFSIWVYQETNGREGLQRGDEVCNHDGPCCSDEADTILI